jgi:uncharacterized protein YmfQ (DUF2313 family)
MAMFKNPLRVGQACGLPIATWVTSSSAEVVATARMAWNAKRLRVVSGESQTSAQAIAVGRRMRRGEGELLGRAEALAAAYRLRGAQIDLLAMALVWATGQVWLPLQPERPVRYRRYSLEDFQQLLMNLLPRGRAWPRDGEDAALLGAWAEELYRVENRGWKLLEEWDPRSTDELFEEWEAFFELPGTGTQEQRRTALIAEWLAGGTLSRIDINRLLKELGIDAQITYWRPFCAGISAVDDSLATDWYSTWTVHVHNPDQVDLVWLQDYLRRIAPAGDYVHVDAAS